MRALLGNVAGMMLAAALPACGADWSPRLAANYLDGRQQQWSAWPTAAGPGGACVSCHTGLTYLLARPALQQALGETQPTEYEKLILDGLRTRVAGREAKDVSRTFTKEPAGSQALGVEAILAALFLARDSHGDKLTPAAAMAFDRLWALQIQDGPSAGAWHWFELDLDPWETNGQSPFYGVTLAALAVAAAPAEYRGSPAVKKGVAELTAYLHGAQESQPLHNRLMMLWASAALPAVWPESARRGLADEALRVQHLDGGWTLASLGPWKERPTAMPSTGSNSYATAVVALALEQAGIGSSDPRLSRALGWLKTQQDPQGGYWKAESMNKRYPAGSMQERFMRDAATAFASLALVSAGDNGQSGAAGSRNGR